MRCHFHPRSKATAVCSACGLSLCKHCQIEDRGSIYCDSCYAAGETEQEDAATVRAQEALASDDLIDLELMDMLDADDGLF